MKDVTLAGYGADVLDVPGDDSGAKQLVLAANDGTELIRFAVTKDVAQWLGRKLLGMHVVGDNSPPRRDREVS